MRMMPVGDSMTIGSAGDFTWRYRMWRHLNTAFGGPFRIVGPHRTVHDPATDTDTSHEYGDPAFPDRARGHLAGWGKGWLHMAQVIRETVAEHRPDMLLVSLGLIDLGFYTDAAGTAANVRRFIGEARAANPSVRMVLLPVIPNIRAFTDPLFAASCEELNIRLAKAVADLDTPASPLLLASHPEGYDIDTDTYDGTHPNARGEHHLAKTFADTLYQGWALGAPYSASG